MRRVTMIEEMFRDCATKEELQTVDSLYRLNNKGSAIVFMLKRIRRQWYVFTGKSGSEEEPPRVIRINEGGQTRLVARL